MVLRGVNVKSIVFALICIVLFLVSGCGSNEVIEDKVKLITCEVIEDGIKTTKEFPAEQGCPEIEIQQEIKEENEKEAEGEPAEGISFDYIVSECDEAIDAHNISEMGIKSINWISDSQVKITAYLSMNCAESIKKSDYEVEGNTLYLTYMVNHCEECATCICAKKITFVLEGIAWKKYQYNLVGF